MTKKKVLVTPEGITKIKINKKKFFSNQIKYFFTGKIVELKKDLIKNLKDVDGCIIGSEKIDREIIDKCPKLKVIVRFGVGLDNIDLAYAKKRGIKVKNTIAKSVSNAVAVHAIGLILLVTQNLHLHISDSKIGKWRRHLNLLPQNTTVGVAGAGNIGSKVIELLLTLGFKVNYFSREKKSYLSIMGAKYFSNLEKLISKSKIITLHLPSFNSNEPIIDERKLDLMKEKYLINLSRGSLVDEKIVYKYLNQKVINLYATDVFAYEPPKKISKKLQCHPKVISTAHVGGYNEFSLKEVSEMALKQINNILLSK